MVVGMTRGKRDMYLKASLLVVVSARSVYSR